MSISTAGSLFLFATALTFKCMYFTCPCIYVYVAYTCTCTVYTCTCMYMYVCMVYMCIRIYTYIVHVCTMRIPVLVRVCVYDQWVVSMYMYEFSFPFLLFVMFSKSMWGGSCLSCRSCWCRQEYPHGPLALSAGKCLKESHAQVSSLYGWNIQM